MASALISNLKKQLPLRKKSMVSFLKKFDTKFVRNINSLVDQASDETWAETNCLSCANCCKVMTPTFTKSDLARIAPHFQMSEKAFYDKWLKTDPETGDKVNRIQPCQFLDLKTNMCSIYEIRPIDCAQFPHFKRKPFGDYNHVHEQNIEYCPATFLFITKLQHKIEAEFVW
ncbi:MAG: YkgJ family cysteine cluster protein [Chitinophagaceae bacterium]|nr:YkgJ family cysteine cluster protein [Chitinophagaceae bacterium]